MSTAPVIFDIAYTPHHLKRGASEKDIAKHAKERAFFTMTGDGDTILRYMTREGKICGERQKKLTILEYLQKSTGVFNGEGMISKEELAEMKFRARSGDKNIWHGFISFDEEHSAKIDSPEKCIELIRRTFPEFFYEAGFDSDNIDLMCSLHLDRPTHLHIHFVFWEKEPKIKNQRAAGYKYRARGRIKPEAIAAMTKRLNSLALGDELTLKKADKYASFKRSKEGMQAFYRDRSEREIRRLAKDLPENCSFRYCDDDLQPFRKRIDDIVYKLLLCDQRLYEKHDDFLELIDKKQKELEGIMGRKYADKLSTDRSYMRPPFVGGSDLKKIKTLERLKWDYNRRLGDIVLREAKKVREHTYKYNKRLKHRANDKRLRRNILFSERRLSKDFEGLFSSLFSLFMPEMRSYPSRLAEIEQEMKEDRQNETAEDKASAQNKNSKYDWGK